MTLDPIRAAQELKGKKRWFDVSAVILCCLMVAGTYLLSYREIVSYNFADFQAHAGYAGDFDFSDPHSITSRIAYPLWHIIVAVIHQMGVPLAVSAAAVSAVVKGGTYVLVYWLVFSMSGGCLKRWANAFLSFAVMMVIAIRVPGLPFYQSVGAPNVWHNPTQQAVTFAQMIVMPWLAHCWYEFERMMDEGKKNVLLPWWKVGVLAFICMGANACKPTFMQALLPAAFVMFLVELIRRKEEWRYFGQIVLAFIPTVAYFLLQYLYYTGVVVEFTSGVAFGITAQTAWTAVRNALMMSACPLAALMTCYRKGLFKDRLIVLPLLMILFAALEAMAFRETGMRQDHGNFTWASDSSSFLLWAVMTGVFFREMRAHVKNGTFTALRKVGTAATAVLFVWQLASGICYYITLMTTESIF